MEYPVAHNRATYDQIAPAFAEQTRNPNGYLREIGALFAERLAAGARVADVGCGPGRDTLLLRELGLTVVGLDLSWEMLRQYGTPGLVQADMRDLPLADRCVDGIWCQASFLHIPKVDAPGVLAEFGRVARRGALLHLAVQEGDHEAWEPVEYAPELLRWFVSHREDELTGWAHAAGFEVEAFDRPGGRRNWLLLRAIRVD